MSRKCHICPLLSAVHTPREPPPPYYAVTGDQQLFPYTQATTEQLTVAA